MTLSPRKCDQCGKTDIPPSAITDICTSCQDKNRRVEEKRGGKPRALKVRLRHVPDNTLSYEIKGTPHELYISTHGQTNIQINCTIGNEGLSCCMTGEQFLHMIAKGVRQHLATNPEAEW